MCIDVSSFPGSSVKTETQDKGCHKYTNSNIRLSLPTIPYKDLIFVLIRIIDNSKIQLPYSY